ARRPSRYPSADHDTLHIPEFHMTKGERVFLYGPSGSGKTTFLEILAGILKAQTGRAEILGHDLTKMSESQRDQFRAEHLGYIFQSFNLIPYLSVQQNIQLPVQLSPARGKHIQNEDPKKMILQMCERLGIAKFLDKRVTELSIGQQQRVAVARALFGRPDLILADEPTSSLDMDHREKFLQLMFELCDQYGTTVLFVSHDRSIQHLFSRSVSLDSINMAAHGQGV
ncbi:MAG: ABC transporter ATP-binding protein, partial [Proteobacteria bacterium]